MTDSARGSVAAFFDMDHTLLSDSSGMLYLRYLRKNGLLSWREWATIMTWAALYIIGRIDFPHMIGRVMARTAGASEDEVWRLSAEWFESILRHYIADGARQCINWHRRQGHHVAIVSASTPYAVRPVARELGLGEAFMATHLEVIDGHFTGRVVEPTCYDLGKVVLAQQYAARHGIDLSQSYFYSDSHRDLALLETVGHPVAVNPSRKLAQIAVTRGWPVVYFYGKMAHNRSVYPESTT